VDLSAFQRKLARLPGAAPAAAEASPSEVPPSPASTDDERRARIAKLRALIGQMEGRERARLKHAPKPTAPKVELPGELIETAHGSLHRRRLYLEPHHAHGEVPVARSLRVSAQTIAG
jgi:hypothetical protein